MFEFFRDYFLGAILGFIAGVLIARFYFRTSIQRRKIGEVIEWAMVEKTISQLESMTTILNRLVADIKSSADELTEKIEIAQDLEPPVKEPSKNKKQS